MVNEYGHGFRTKERHYSDAADKLRAVMLTLDASDSFENEMKEKLSTMIIAFDEAALIEEDEYLDRA